ncbi:MAG TPA: DUF2809 domain-containing protein [Gemmatirosa sp.]
MRRVRVWLVRVRLVYVARALATIALGLGVHFRGRVLGPALRDVVGDALWGAMIAWWVGAAAPAARISRRATVALAICCGVEFGQRYHAPWIDAIRATTLGHLMLGSDFDPRDLAAYALGVGAAVVVERMLRVPRSRRRGSPVRS